MDILTVTKKCDTNAANNRANGNAQEQRQTSDTRLDSSAASDCLEPYRYVVECNEKSGVEAKSKEAPGPDTALLDNADGY